MSDHVSGTEVIFSDNFSGSLNPGVWHYPTGPGSYYNLTQIRPSFPVAGNGVLNLQLDTYNPSWNQGTAGPTFFGSEAITNRLFDLSAGPIAFEFTVRYPQTQRGIVGGFFTYGGPANSHDEIDFEAMSKFFDRIQTNVYHNEPAGNGHPEAYAFPKGGTLGDWHTYRFEWYPNSVRWLVDGVVARTVTDTELVPNQPMALHLNVWGSPADWPLSGDPSLVPVRTPDQNRTFYFHVGPVKVEKLSTVAGTAAAETLMGTASNDWMDGAEGNDVLAGGLGTDTAAFLSNSSGYTVMAGQDSVFVLDRQGGLDTLVDVERIQFADRLLDAEMLTKAASVSSSQLSDLTDLYVAYFDRAPDALGLYYWASRVSDGMTFEEIAKSFAVQHEALLHYGTTTTATEFVTKVYDNVLGRAPDASGLQYWVNELQAERVSQEDFILAFIGGARAPTGSALDAQTLANKNAVGQDYAVNEGLSDVAWAHAVMAGVDNSAASVAAAQQLIDSYAATALTSQDAHLVVEVVGISAA